MGGRGCDNRHNLICDGCVLNDTKWYISEFFKYSMCNFTVIIKLCLQVLFLITLQILIGVLYLLYH